MGNVSVDSEMASNTMASALTASTLAYSFTNTAGTRLLVGVVASNNSLTLPFPSACMSVQYAGKQLTRIGQVRFHNNADDVLQRAELSWWYLDNPATGANNVQVDLNTTATGVISGALSVTGAGKISPVYPVFEEKSVTAAAVTVPNTVTTSSLILALLGTGSGYSSTSKTLSASANVNTNTAANNAAIIRTAGTGSDVSMDATISADYWCMLGLEVFGSITDTTYKKYYSGRQRNHAAIAQRRGPRL